MSGPRLLAVLAVLAALSAAGCSLGLRPVRVEARSPLPGTAAPCDRLMAALPRVVDDGVRREVEPDDGATAAWGAPPVVLRCGVPRPPEYRPDAQLLAVDGVEWLPVAGDGGVFFTTVGRTADVEVAVPDDYAPEAAVLVTLAPAVREALPQRAAQSR